MYDNPRWYSIATTMSGEMVFKSNGSSLRLPSHHIGELTVRHFADTVFGKEIADTGLPWGRSL